VTDGRKGALEMLKNTDLKYVPDMSVCPTSLLLFLLPISSILPFFVPRRQSFNLKSISVVSSFSFSCLFRTAVLKNLPSVCCVTSSKQKSSVWAELAVWCLCYAFPFPGSGRDPHDSHLYLHAPFAYYNRTRRYVGLRITKTTQKIRTTITQKPLQQEWNSATRNRLEQNLLRLLDP